MLNFCFVHGDDTRHVMKLQLQVLSFDTSHLLSSCECDMISHNSVSRSDFLPDIDTHTHIDTFIEHPKLKYFTHMFVLHHRQMLVVWKEGKQHDRYNSFRSAFELLEEVGRDPQDCFVENNEDLSPLQKLT